MPYKCESLKIPTALKRSAKLTQGQKDEIRYRYLKIGDISQRELAREYGVSRRLIVFCIYPTRAKINYQARVTRGGSKIYYDKDMHRAAMKKHRTYKHKLYREGKLEGEGTMRVDRSDIEYKVFPGSFGDTYFVKSRVPDKKNINPWLTESVHYKKESAISAMTQLKRKTESLKSGIDA